MDETQRAAFLQSQVACAMIAAMGMVAANHDDALAGRNPTFHQPDFDALPDRFGIGHNAAVTWLHGQ